MHKRAGPQTVAEPYPDVGIALSWQPLAAIGSMRFVPLALVALFLLPSMLPAASAEPAWGDAATAIIRPGASLGGYCTLNFVFADDAGNAYIGTAAHCTDDVGERVATSGLGAFGTVVYDSDLVAGTSPQNDFSLILIDAHLVARTHPAMIGHEGPTGVAQSADLAVGDRVDVYGYGMVVGSLAQTRARWGVLMDADAESYRENMPAVNGDSGAPLLHHETGKALGIISHYGINVPPTTDEGPLMTLVLDDLEAAGWQVRLVTV